MSINFPRYEIPHPLRVEDDDEIPSPDELIDNDEVPLETPWHRNEIGLLVDSVEWHWRGRQDFYTGGNMFIYYSAKQARNRDYRGPDFFVVKGVNREPMRRYWARWHEENRYPDMIIELLSESTAEIDRTVKKELYRTEFKTLDYYCYDPDSQTLEGWHLTADGAYAPIAPDDRGRLWCESLQLSVGLWPGRYLQWDDVWLRFFHPDGSVVLIGEEHERQQAADAAARADAERQRAESARQLADAERQRAESERQQAAAERQRAESERQRAEQAEARADAERQQRLAVDAELDRLRRELAALRAQPPQPE